MKKFSTLVMCMSLALMLASCSKGKTDSIFGKVPSIYETQFGDLTREAEFIYANQSDYALAQKVVEKKADSVISIAFDLAKPEATRMKGYKVECSVDEELPYTIDSDMEIKGIELLEHAGDNVVCYVYLAFDMSVKEDVREFYYIFTGEFGDIGAGVYTYPETVSTEGHQLIRLPMPGVPAKYAERCQKIRFVSRKTYDEAQDVLKIRHAQWKMEYKEELEK